MQQAMVTMMISLMMAMTCKYVHSIEIHKKDSLEEKQWVEQVFKLYAIFWMLATGIHFNLASDPHLLSHWNQ